MNKGEFINSIKKHLRNTIINGVYEYFSNPPGRKISKKQRDIADWLKKNSQTENQYIKYIIENSVDQTIFDFLCVFDGVQKIIDDDGHFRLTYITENEEIELNIEDTEDLHDIYNSG